MGAGGWGLSKLRQVICVSYNSEIRAICKIQAKIAQNLAGKVFQFKSRSELDDHTIVLVAQQNSACWWRGVVPLPPPSLFMMITNSFKMIFPVSQFLGVVDVCIMRSSGRSSGSSRTFWRLEERAQVVGSLPGHRGVRIEIAPCGIPIRSRWAEKT